MRLTYLVLGHARSGKDTFAEAFCYLKKLNFYSSSYILAEEVVFPVLGPKYGYKDFKECYEDRNDHRIEWRDLLIEYNTPDKARLAKLILSKADMYVGMRTLAEYEACEAEGLFDVVYYVNASPRVEENDPSMTIPFDPERMQLVDNSGNKWDFFQRIEALAGN